MSELDKDQVMKDIAPFLAMTPILRLRNDQVCGEDDPSRPFRYRVVIYPPDELSGPCLNIGPAFNDCLFCNDHTELLEHFVAERELPYKPWINPERKLPVTP